MSEPEVFVVADNIFSPLGKTTAENFTRLKQGLSGVKEHSDVSISPSGFFASLFDKDEVFVNSSIDNYTKFEQLLIASVEDALRQSGVDPTDKKNVLIISSTKGNISLLETEAYTPALKEKISLPHSAKLISTHFGFVNQPIIVSNACISGILGIITAMRLLRSGQYENAVIAGADVISKFIFSGFQSFQALSQQICKPFDKWRDGLNLGEGAATVVLSTDKKYKGNIKVKGGAVSNDANHISGPSRTGEELADAIKKAMGDASIGTSDIAFISAHGTATPYNDEMEAKAIALTGLQDAPLNSLKGYYGHTLGAAGLIETVISIHSLTDGVNLPTVGFKELDTNIKVNISATELPANASNFIKTASGFGGCNAVVVVGK